jgi:phytoene dehydrogenase-like protein
MMIHLALSDLPAWKAGAELKKYAYVHIAPSLSEMSLTYEQAISGILPERPVLVVGQPTAIDPSRAPEGKHILWIQVRAVPSQVKGDAKGELKTSNWAEVKEPYAERLLDQLTSYAPNLREIILAKHLMSPADLERFNPNLVGGCNISGSHHLRQNFIFRPFPGYSRYKTPIKNLYMVGASTWPGAGVGAGSGRLLGKMLSH